MTVVSPGDRVRVRRDAPHTFDAFLGEEAEVTARRTIGGRPWVRLRFASGRETWLPASRLEPVEEEAA